MNTQSTKPIFWVNTLYFMQGIPYALVMLVSAILLKQFNFTNSQIAFYTSLFILPWVIKFLFAPFFEQLGTKRFLIIITEAGLAIIAAGIAFLLYLQYIKLATVLFFFMAWVSSWHDITTDGFYLISLSRAQQIQYVGLRTLAFQGARLFCQGGVVVAIGFLLHYFPLNKAWMLGFIFLAILMLSISIYHYYLLPRVETAPPTKSTYSFFPIFQQFFAKTNIVSIVIFLLFYNIAEAQLLKIVPLFLLDVTGAGGLHMDIKQVGFLYGSLGIGAMLGGIFISAWLIRQFGLKQSLMGLTALLLFSQIGYIIISANIAQHNHVLIIAVILFGQFCYGLSNNAYMVSLLDLARGHEYSMSFYALATGIMALGMMLPGAVSGYLQHYLGYFNFFIWIVLLQASVLYYTKYFIRHFNYEYSGLPKSSANVN